MDATRSTTTNRFDEIARLVGKQTTRRQALRAFGLGLGALALGTRFDRASATTADFAKTKCDWIKASGFPQDTAGVQALGAKLAGVEPERISTNIYRCDTKGNAVFDGFVVLGPNEGYSGDVTLTVPAHGAIDGAPADCGYTYSGGNSEVATLPNHCDSTVRATSGTVTGPRMTYYVYNDDAPPAEGDKYDAGKAAGSTTKHGGGASGTPEADKTDWCMSVDDLLKNPDYVGKFEIMASSEQTDDITKYGGRRVTALSNFDLPDGWAAKTNGVDLAGGDTVMQGDTVTIYPPNGACRDKLNVSR